LMKTHLYFFVFKKIVSFKIVPAVKELGYVNVKYVNGGFV
jgi:hypothetical protein